MLASAIILFLTASVKVSTGSKCENPSYLTCALNDIVKTFTNISGEVTIANYGSEIDVVESLVINLKEESVPFRIRNYDMIDDQNMFKVDESSIMTFDSVKKLNIFNNKVNLTNIHASPFKFYVVCENATFDDISLLKENDIQQRSERKGGGNIQNELTDILQFQYFIIDEEFGISLVTFVWYTAEKCSEPQLIEINRFDKKTKRWINRNFFIKKFVNFHGCQLMFGIPKQGSASSYQIQDKDTVDYWGYQLKFIEGMSNSLNFKYCFNPYFHETKEFYFKNSSVDLIITQFMTNSFRDKFFYSQPYRFLNHYVAVPPGESYTRYEKLFVPFDSDTWTVIVAAFFTAYATIIVLNYLNEKIKHYVSGSKFRPSVNIVAIIIGTSQITLPKRNFARFLVILFIVYCLIISTVWKTQIFSFLQHDFVKPGVRSIEEMIAKNFTLYLMQNVNLLKGMDLVTR